MTDQEIFLLAVCGTERRNLLRINCANKTNAKQELIADIYVDIKTYTWERDLAKFSPIEHEAHISYHNSGEVHVKVEKRGEVHVKVKKKGLILNELTSKITPPLQLSSRELLYRWPMIMINGIKRLPLTDPSGSNHEEILIDLDKFSSMAIEVIVNVLPKTSSNTLTETTMGQNGGIIFLVRKTTPWIEVEVKPYL